MAAHRVARGRERTHQILVFHRSVALRNACSLAKARWRIERDDQELKPLKHEGRVTFATFSPDGRYVLTRTDDNTAWVWPIEDQGEPLKWSLGSDHNISLRFTPDSQQVITLSADGTRQVWELRPEVLMDRLKAIQGCIPPNARVRYRGDSEEDAWTAYAECEVSQGRPRPQRLAETESSRAPATPAPATPAPATPAPSTDPNASPRP